MTKAKQNNMVISHNGRSLSLETVSPGQSNTWLTATRRAEEVEGHRINRGVKETHVEHFRAVFDLGENDPFLGIIHITKEGLVINGQHRLKAIAAGSKAQWCLVARNMKRDDINKIDLIVNPRSLAQAENINNPKMTSATNMLAGAVVCQFIEHGEHEFLTIFQRRELLAKYEPDIRAAFDILSGNSVRLFRRSGVFGAMAYMRAAAREKVDHFAAELAHKVDFKSNSPAGILHGYLMVTFTEDNKKNLARSQERLIYATLHALRHHIAGTTFTRMKSSPDSLIWARDYRKEHAE